MDAVDRAGDVTEAWLGGLHERVRRHGEELRGGVLPVSGGGWPRLCAECLEPIPRERQRVAPRAERCVDCQQECEWMGRLGRSAP